MPKSTKTKKLQQVIINSHRRFGLGLMLVFACMFATTSTVAAKYLLAAPVSALSLCGNQAPASPMPIQHVVEVMMENHSYKSVVGSSNAPYQTSLSTQCGNATVAFGATHTSAANYLATSAGEFPAASPPGCGSVKACSDNSENLYHQLDTAGLSWKAYQESMASPCDQSSSGAYKIGHNPPMFYSDIPLSECQAKDVPVADLTAQTGAFYTDLQNQTLPNFSWVTPDLNNDGEGSGGAAAALKAADSWLQKFVTTVQQSNSYQSGNTLVIINYDEGTGADTTTGEDCTNQALDLPVTNGTSAHQDSCHVPFFVLNPYTQAAADTTFFDHYSITKTVEDLFGLPYIAHAADVGTNSLLGHFGITNNTLPSPSPTPSPSPSPSPSPTPSPSPSPTPTPTPTPSPTPSPATACLAVPSNSTELSGNVSLEANQTGWTGVYNTNSVPKRVQLSGGSYDGTWALQVSPKAAGTAGVNNAAPIWVPGSPGVSATAGMVYTGSAFVRASTAGEQISLMVRETTPSGSGVGYHTTTTTYNDTNWHQISSAYKASKSGDAIRYSLYANNLTGPSQNFVADCLSLQSS